MVKLVRVCDGLRPLVTVCQFAMMMLAIEHRPPHLYECFWRHYFRTSPEYCYTSYTYLFVLFTNNTNKLV